jgi:hypothetical protein
MSMSGMAGGWYFSKQGEAAVQRSGPFSWEELYAQAQAGMVGPDDRVWHPQLPQWLSASRVPGLLTREPETEGTATGVHIR